MIYDCINSAATSALLKMSVKNKSAQCWANTWKDKQWRTGCQCFCCLIKDSVLRRCTNFRKSETVASLGHEPWKSLWLGLRFFCICKKSGKNEATDLVVSQLWGSIIAIISGHVPGQHMWPSAGPGQSSSSPQSLDQPRAQEFTKYIGQQVPLTGTGVGFGEGVVELCGSDRLCLNHLVTFFYHTLASKQMVSKMWPEFWCLHDN